jgi:hypothetical protein
MARVDHDVPDLIEDEPITSTTEFHRSKGAITCQDAASAFLEHFAWVGQKGTAVLSCFLNELRVAVNAKFGDGYWERERPGEIIETANEAYFQLEEKQEMSPISKETFK